MIFDLQLFDDAPPVEVETPAEIETVDEVDAKIDAALSKYAAKLEASYKKQIEAAKKEEQRLQKMSDDERREAELESTRAALETKEQELKLKEIELEMSKVLEQRGVPLNFMEYFLTNDSEATLERIKKFEKVFKSEIEKAVNEKLKGKTPPASSTPTVLINGAGSLAELIRKNQARR